MTRKRIALWLAINMLSIVAAWRHFADLFGSWFLRLEGPNVGCWILLGAWWLFPLTALLFGVLIQRHRMASTFRRLSLVYCAIYLFYALMGPSEEGMNLQIVAVPIFLALLTFLLVVVDATKLLRRRAREQRIASPEGK